MSISDNHWFPLFRRCIRHSLVCIPPPCTSGCCSSPAPPWCGWRSRRRWLRSWDPAQTPAVCNIERVTAMLLMDPGYWIYFVNCHRLTFTRTAARASRTSIVRAKYTCNIELQWEGYSNKLANWVVQLTSVPYSLTKSDQFSWIFP